MAAGNIRKLVVWGFLVVFLVEVQVVPVAVLEGLMIYLLKFLGHTQVMGNKSRTFLMVAT